jgi:hypothetical protein
MALFMASNSFMLFVGTICGNSSKHEPEIPSMSSGVSNVLSLMHQTP